jgi:rifampicin phosphotransferase
MSDILPFLEIAAADAERVGGKGLSLGRLAVAGLPVPPGFCITTDAYQRCNGTSIDSLLQSKLDDAYRALGRGLVAVRSSATTEDSAAASFAGQQETILGVEGDAALRESIERCWQSLHTQRARAYRQKQGVDEAGLAMAVVVQKLVPAEVAGVLFTRDPLDPSGERMLVEASWGLGEVVVSGRVQPDRFQIGRSKGDVRDRQLGRKAIRITPRGDEPVPADQQDQFSLSDPQLVELANLGRQVEAHYGDARDVEWAYATGRFWLLQARPITTAGAAEREQIRRSETAKLKELAEPDGTVWSRYNLVEVLPEPTPMTWAVVQRLLSGGGGSGQMYRDFGFDPDPALESISVYDLIGGRPYCNLSREPLLQSRRPLFGYPFVRYKEAPHLAMDPKPDTSKPLISWWRRLGAYWGLIGTSRRILKQSKTFPEEFHERIVPPFTIDVERANAEDLAKLDEPALLNRFDYWVQRTLVDFARHSLKPTLLAQFCLQVLEQQLRKPLGDERTRSALAELSAFAKPEREADLSEAIRDLSRGQLDRQVFLQQFGHRGTQEMELAQPRWAEEGERAAPLQRGTEASQAPRPRAEGLTETWSRIAGEAKLNSFLAKWLLSYAERLQTFLGLRETAKHHLMRGYALIRQSLVELDRRHRLAGGIFFLIPEELPQLLTGADLAPLIAARRKERALALSLEVPPVVFSDDLEAIGRPAPSELGAAQLQGVPLSAGVAEGPALVLTDVGSAPPAEAGYILVCPSTDPSWVPLFVQARGLVMESGGVLSHGAIVAREFGLPAVAGLPGIQRQLRTGQRLRVDGSRGIVTVL